MQCVEAFVSYANSECFVSLRYYYRNYANSNPFCREVYLVPCCELFLAIFDLI